MADARSDAKIKKIKENDSTIKNLFCKYRKDVILT